MLTGQGSEVDQHAGFAAGADDFVTKPFRISDLLDRIGVWARTRERLKAAHAQVLAEHARLLAEQERSRALAERAAQDEAVVVMARTAADELAQPLTVLRGYLELVGSQRYPTQHIPQVWPELERALAELEERFDRLRCAIRYETKHIGSVKVIDLLRAHEY